MSNATAPCFVQQQSTLRLALLHYADQCYHHYDDFIVPKGGWWSAVKKVFSQKDLKTISMKQYLQCYTNAFDNPPTLRRMLCQDVSAAIEDICCKYAHLKDGYTCPTHYSYGQAEPLNESSCFNLKYVRAQFVVVSILLYTSSPDHVFVCRSSKNGWELWFIVFMPWLGSHLVQQK